MWLFEHVAILKAKYDGFCMMQILDFFLFFFFENLQVYVYMESYDLEIEK